MKRTITTILCAAAVAMAAVSCQTEKINPPERDKGTVEISIDGLMPEYSADVKSELVNTMRVSWKNGDVVYVYDGKKCLGSLVAALDGEENRYAKLSTDDSHTVTEPEEGTTMLTLVHSPLLPKDKGPGVSGNAVSISLAEQDSQKAPFVVFATLNYSGTTIKDAIVPFKFATSVIKVNCTGLKANTAIDKARLSNVNTVCKLTLSGTAAPSVAGDVNGIITRTGDAYFAAGKVNAEGEAVFQIAVPELVSGDRVLSIVQESGSYGYEDKKFSKDALPAAQSVNTVCQLETENNFSYFVWDENQKKLVEKFITSSACKFVDETTIELDGGFWVVKDEIALESPVLYVDCDNSTTLILCDGAHLYGSQGTNILIYRGDLVICGQEGNTGRIEAYSNFGTRAIGGEYYFSLTINGGKVTADGRGKDGKRPYAGIGSPYGFDLTINGGTVTATGGYEAAGIGGDTGCEGGNVVINGGTVTATGGVGAAGIGGGVSGDSGDFTINDGTVTATSSSSDDYGYPGAGIGCGGAGTFNGTVTINGGTITATGGYYNDRDFGQGIGCGSDSYDEGTVAFASGKTFVIYAGKDSGDAKEVTPPDKFDHKQKYVNILTTKVK